MLAGLPRRSLGLLGSHPAPTTGGGSGADSALLTRLGFRFCGRSSVMTSIAPGSGVMEPQWIQHSLARGSRRCTQQPLSQGMVLGRGLVRRLLLIHAAQAAARWAAKVSRRPGSIALPFLVGRIGVSPPSSTAWHTAGAEYVDCRALMAACMPPSPCDPQRQGPALPSLQSRGSVLAAPGSGSRRCGPWQRRDVPHILFGWRCAGAARRRASGKSPPTAKVTGDLTAADDGSQMAGGRTPVRGLRAGRRLSGADFHAKFNLVPRCRTAGGDRIFIHQCSSTYGAMNAICLDRRLSAAIISGD
jgi:hypothetical protein